MICPKCSQEVVDGAQVCPYCGEPMPVATPVAPVAPDPAPAQPAYDPYQAQAPAQPQYQANPYQQPPVQPQYQANPYAPQPAPSSEKNKLVAGLLAIFLGTLGIHKFYLGYTKSAVIMLVVSLVGSLLFGLGPVVMGVIALIEGIMYLTKDDATFYNTYVANQKEWF